jgi:hypothetical protein
MRTLIYLFLLSVCITLGLSSITIPLKMNEYRCLVLDIYND